VLKAFTIIDLSIYGAISISPQLVDTPGCLAHCFIGPLVSTW
jgi:hypothetical protein